jgi:ABC-2 type transport system ATP-binding protein
MSEADLVSAEMTGLRMVSMWNSAGKLVPMQKRRVVRITSEDQHEILCPVGDDAAPGVEVTDLTKRYGDVPAVDGVSLTIPRGQIFGLLGPNSAGKTTLIECIEGIRSADSGSVRVLGLEYRDSAREIKTRTGVQLQKTGFYDLLNLRETLEFYASFYPRPLNVEELMGRLQIRDRAKTLVKDMSGGILQRMSLGVALVNDPELIFLDEPTTGLDPQARRVIWDVVRSLRADGRTVVLTTHYMDEAEQLCDRVAVMTAGKIRSQGAPDELIHRYVGESLVEIVPAGDFDAAAASALPGVRGCSAQGERLVLRADEPAALLTTILALPGPPAEARLRRGTLEDVFLTIAELEQRP